MPASSTLPHHHDASGLGRDLLLSSMARALENVVQLTNPFQRKVELRRAGYVDPHIHDELEAVKRVLLKRRALAAPARSLAA